MKPHTLALARQSWQTGHMVTLVFGEDCSQVLVGEVSQVLCSLVCLSFLLPAFELCFLVEEFSPLVLLGVRDCLSLCVVSDPFALGHTHMALIFPPGIPTSRASVLKTSDAKRQGVCRACCSCHMQ